MESSYLVQKGSLEEVLGVLLEKQKTIIEDLSKAIPLLHDPELIKKLSTQKTRAEAQLKALQEGYVPVSGGWFWDIDTKSRWGKQAVKQVLETMPEEVKTVMEAAKKSEHFEKVKVTGSRAGDPMLVGTAGGKNFLLALWCNLEGGYSVGLVVPRLRRKVLGTA